MKFDESYRMGAEKVVSLIREDETRGCNTNYMLVGYSQGVISLRLAIGLLGEDADKIVSTYVVGDPFQTAFAAWSAEHRSPANSSFGTVGIGHNAANVVSNPLFPGGPLLAPFVYYYQATMIQADPMVYQHDTFKGRFSRALCHAGDPVCGIEPTFSMDNHLNYFSTEEDLAYEIEAFDNQVEFLANSTPKVSNYRGLSSIPGKDGKVTYYVSGARMVIGSADTCEWDKDSDGVYDTFAIGCGLNTFVHDSLQAKMTVKITDYVGNVYIRSTETETFEDKTLEEFYALDQDSWYQIHPYGNPDYCLTFIQDSYEDIDNLGRTFFENQECGPTNVDPNDAVALIEASKQAFKTKEITDPNTGESRIRLSLGYDEDFSIFESRTLDSYLAFPIGVTNRDGFTESDFSPQFVTIDGSTAYYSFVSPIDFALSQNMSFAAPNYNYGIGSTYYTDIMRYHRSVLWSVTPIQGDFGSLSNEKDVTPPNEVENLTIRALDETSVFLEWDSSTDNRGGELIYRIYEAVNGDRELIEETSDTEVEVMLESNKPYKNITIVVEAVDNKNNSSSGSSISFTTPSNFIPEEPTLNCVCENYSSAIINLPSAWIPEVDHVEVYRNGSLVGITSEAVYEDDGLVRGETYDYSYKVVTPSGLISEMSDFLRVQMADVEIPTAPTNLIFKKPFADFVEITWDAGIDATDEYLTYHLYRDGVKLSDYFFTYQNGAIDYQTERGRTYVYTVVAEDSFGNLSPVSEPLIVAVPVYVDETSPETPILSLNSAFPTRVSFSINSNDQGGWIEQYDIYRDGSLVATVTEPYFEDESVSPNSTYEYSVIARDNSGNESLMSEVLEVNTFNLIAPTPPTNLQIAYQWGSEVSINWSPGSDDLDSFLTYYLYRDGVELTEGFYAYDFGGYDYLAEPGATYVYTVVTEDSSGNRSDSSDPITVTIAESHEEEDLLSPTKPQLSLIAAWNEAIGFTLYAEDNQGIASFDIYRDGVYITNTVDWFYYDQGLTPETIYEYTVIARDYSDNTSEVSDPLTVSTIEGSSNSGPGGPPATAVPKVESFNLDYVAHNIAQISWTINSQNGFSYLYDVYRDGVLVAENRNWNPYAGGINTEPFSYTDSELQEDMTYVYEVVIKNHSGQSSEISDPFAVHTHSAPTGSTDEVLPSGVKILSVYESENGVFFGWTPALDDQEVASYEIYRDGVLIHTLNTSSVDYYGTFYDDAEVAASPVGTVHSYQIVVVDSSGNRNDSSPAFTYAVGG